MFIYLKPKAQVILNFSALRKKFASRDINFIFSLYLIWEIRARGEKASSETPAIEISLFRLKKASSLWRRVLMYI